MVWVTRVSVLLLTCIFLTACFDDDDNDREPELRVFHASPDAPPVNILVDGDTVANSLNFASATPVTILENGTYSLQVDGILPGSTATVIGPVDQQLDDETRYDVVAINTVASIEPLIITTPLDFDTSQVRVTVAHLAPDAPEVDVHVTEPGAALDANTVLGTFSFRGTLGPVEIAAGDYRIRVTLPGTTTVVYDSGTVSLAAGSDLLIGAIANTSVTDTASAKSPIALVVIDGDDVTRIFSAADGADLRIVHNSADAPLVDIVVNDNFAEPLVEDLAFPDFTAPYTTVPGATYNVKVAAANTTTAVIDAQLDLNNATAYTVIALNLLAEIEPLVLEDDPRTIATEARVRVVHGSTLAGAVDVYVTAVGADINDLDPAIIDFEFKEDSGYIGLAAGAYDVTLTPTGTKTAALGPISINIANGEIYTAIARDEAGLTGVNLILLDSFVL